VEFDCLYDTLQAFGLLDVPPPPIPTVTLTLRHRTEHVWLSQLYYSLGKCDLIVFLRDRKMLVESSLMKRKLLMC
jgi:hypothetical protein